MPPNPRPSPLPEDDLYRRLEVPANASAEAIEVAWRALLKRYHPDIAGDDALEHAKRINIAHDWLSDPALRERYDAARAARGTRPRGGVDGRRRASGWPERVETAPATVRPDRPARAIDLVERRRRFLERVGSLSRDELDRLACAESPPLAFIAAIRRFLGPERLAAVETIEADVRARLDPAAWAHGPSRDAVLGAAHELVLGEFLDEHLDEPYRERAHERLTRAWDAAAGQPRYGPNGAAVRRFVERAGALAAAELQALEDSPGTRPARGELPWPADIDPAEDEGLRVSSVLAARDAVDAVRRTWPAPSRRVRTVLAWTAHALVLRHAFDAATFDNLTAQWRAATGAPATAPPSRDPSVRRADREAPPR